MGRGRILERESQLAALLSYADEARAGEGRMALVSGEAGIGKSTLVEELETRLPDAIWCWGACDGLSTPRPLGPLTDIAVGLGGVLLNACVGDASRDVRFDTLLAVLRDRAELHVLVIEDLHWSDEATLDMLRFLARRIRNVRVLVVVTFRDDALTPHDPLRVTLGDLATHRATRRVMLGPLSEQAVRRLGVERGVDAAALHRLTGGNPFFVTEVLAAGAPGVPGSARDLVLARAAGLGLRARGLLDLAALIGIRMTPAALLAAGDAAPDTLDELLTIGILAGDGVEVRFRHEIARQAVQEQVAPHRAIELHRAILASLLTHDTTDDALLAFHADAASDSARVLDHAPRAARSAAAMSSHREAAAQFERAVRHSEAAGVRTRAALHDDLADELALVEQWEASARTRQAAIELWRQAADTLREGDAESRLATCMWRLCRGPEAVAARRRARALLEPSGTTPELAALYAGGADSVDPDVMAAHIATAVDMTLDLDLPAIRVRALNGVAHIRAGRMGDWESPLREALGIALDHDLQQQAGLTYANLTEYHAAEFRLADVEPLFLEAMAYCDEHDVSTYGNCVRGHYALALLDSGRWDEALSQADEVLATRASPINRLTLLITAGLVHARRGLASAAPYLAEADAVATGVDEPQYLAMAALALAEAAWLADDHAGARARLAKLRPRLTALEVKESAAVTAWEQRLGVPPVEVAAFAPYAAQLSGPPRRAAMTWDALGMPYHAALALADSSDPSDLREAVGRLDLMSPPAARIARRRMREQGLRAVPVGVRTSTRSDPDGLTRREREVRELVRLGLTNEQIADRLVISVKTVDHHVSAVLAKLGVASRREA